MLCLISRKYSTNLDNSVVINDRLLVVVLQLVVLLSNQILVERLAGLHYSVDFIFIWDHCFQYVTLKPLEGHW